MGTYTGAKVKILCSCNKDQYQWNALPSHLLKGHGCPKCANKVKTTEDFIRELETKNPRIIILGEYINATTKIKCMCKQCGKILNITPNALLSGKGCYDCNMNTHIKNITKTHEQFIEDIMSKNINVKILGEYKNSKTDILCECPSCKYIWNAKPDNLLNGTKCPKCAGTLRKTHDDFIKELNIINPNVTILDNYINAKSKNHCKCKICNYEWFATPDSLIHNKTGCPKCRGGVQKTHEEFINRMNTINSNIKILDIYTNAKTKILCQCKICGNKWSALPNSLLRKHGCPKCDIERKCKTHNEFINEMLSINSNIEILDTYSGISNKILCKCKICGNEWKPTPDSLLHGHGCPVCNKSHGEREIEKYLISKSIKYISQKTFSLLVGVNGGNLSYDFYLPNHNALIEFQGIQHEKPIDFNGKGTEDAKENFRKQQEHDKRKRKYAQDHNIELLEIWYYDFDNIDEILFNFLFKKSA